MVHDGYVQGDAAFCATGSYTFKAPAPKLILPTGWTKKIKLRNDLFLNFFRQLVSSVPRWKWNNENKTAVIARHQHFTRSFMVHRKQQFAK